LLSLGIQFPAHLAASNNHAAIANVLQGAEDLGFDYVSVGDHILGADTSARPDWRPYFGKPPLYDTSNVRHEVFILFGLFAALTTRLEFATGILISPQRQTVLLAKQAAEIDFLSGGRLRLVLATGWNDVEYEALGMDFHQRGRMLDEQVEVLRDLWTHEVVNYRGEFTTINSAGINPLPVQRPIPVWFGGATHPVLRRVGRTGDGWFPSCPYFNEAKIRKDIDEVRRFATEAGRDPDSIGIQGMAFFRDDRFKPEQGDELPPTTLEGMVDLYRRWADLGATHFTLIAPPWAEKKDPDSLLKAMAEFAGASRE
jgi:probable F420-dependent oxidoreductase